MWDAPSVLGSKTALGVHERTQEAGGRGAHPQEGVQGTILHELSEDHDRHTVGDHAL